jgi:hypothetical protein
MATTVHEQDGFTVVTSTMDNANFQTRQQPLREREAVLKQMKAKNLNCFHAVSFIKGTQLIAVDMFHPSPA